MLKFILAVALVALVACRDEPERPHDRVHFKIKGLNVLHLNKTGGVPFGIGAKKLNTSLVWFKKMRHGKATDLTEEELQGINVYMKIDDCKHHDDEEDKKDDKMEKKDDKHHHHEKHHHRCRPHIAGFVKVDSPSCCLKGHYLIGYGKASHRFGVYVRGCHHKDEDKDHHHHDDDHHHHKDM